MRTLTYSLGATLDGFVMGPDGSFDWGAPDDEVFRFCIEEVRGVGVHLMGRRLYETMLYWETAEEEQELDDAELEWTTLWKALPKVVFSRSLASVEGSNTRLATRSLADEIAALRAEPEPGNIAIGGAELAAEAASLGLIDEYRLRIHPVLVGGGTPYFARNEQQVALELVEARTFASQVQFLHYRVIR